MKVTNIHTTVVTDGFGNTRTFAVGVENGMVIGNSPGWWKIDPDHIDQMIEHLELVRDAARKHGRRDR